MDNNDYKTIDKSGFFDREWYLETNKDVMLSGIDPVSHWIRFGHIENRDPGPKFSVVDYRSLHPDCSQAVNPILHALRNGNTGNINPSRKSSLQLEERIWNLNHGITGKSNEKTLHSGTSVIYPMLIDPEKIEKISVIKLDHIGDIHLSLDAMQKTRKIFTNAEFTVICNSWAYSMFSSFGFDRHFILDAVTENGCRARKLPVSERVMQDIRGLSSDIAIDMRVERDMQRFLFDTDSTIKVAFDPAADFFLPRLDGSRISNRHQLMHLVESIPVLVRNGFNDFRATVHDPFTICLHMGTSVANKLWLQDRWKSLATRLMNLGYRVWFGCSPAEHALVSSFVQSFGGQVLPIVPIHEYAHVIKDLCDVYVGLDTGPTHAVAYQGVPVIELIGGMVRHREWISQGINVIGLTRMVSCSPCFRVAGCNHNMDCLNVGVDDVLWALEKILDDVYQCNVR